MPHKIVWNKAHTKVAIYSTISEGFLTGYRKPDNFKGDFDHWDLVKRGVFRICPCCDQKLPKKK